MCCRWLMPFFALAVISATPEARLARQLEHEAQFQLRFARQDAARQKRQIAAWLSPNPNRDALLHSQPPKKGISHDSH